jgi:hypothetical protein
MMGDKSVKPGSKLPEGMVVYWLINDVIRKENNHKQYGTISYKYDPGDGLWATILTREHWKMFPYRHPHATLFDILNKNFEI